MKLTNFFKRKKYDIFKIEKFIFKSHQEYIFENNIMTLTALETVATNNAFYLNNEFNPKTNTISVKCNGCYLFDGLQYEIKKDKELHYIVLFPYDTNMKSIYKEITVTVRDFVKKKEFNYGK